MRLQVAEPALQVLELPVEQGVGHVAGGRRREEALLELLEALAHARTAAAVGPQLRQRVGLPGDLDLQPVLLVEERPDVLPGVGHLPLEARELAGVGGVAGLALLLVVGHDVGEPVVVEAELPVDRPDLLLQLRHGLLQIAEVALEGRGLLAYVLELVLLELRLLHLERGPGPLELRAPPRLVGIDDHEPCGRGGRAAAGRRRAAAGRRRPRAYQHDPGGDHQSRRRRRHRRRHRRRRRGGPRGHGARCRASRAR